MANDRVNKTVFLRSQELRVRFALRSLLFEYFSELGPDLIFTFSLIYCETFPRSCAGHLIQPPSHQRLCHNLQNCAHWCFCHSGLDPESSFFKVLRYWIPDQVRHDRYKLNAF